MKLGKNCMDFTVIILAGGHSSRMGEPKPWIKNESGITFLNEIISSYVQFGISNIIVVLNELFTKEQWQKEYQIVNKKAIIVKNNQVDKGRLFSLKLGLTYSNDNYNIIHNVDNPFVEYKVLNELFNNINENGVTIPTYNNKGGHPIIINEKVKKEIISNYKQYTTLKELLLKFDKKYVAVESNSILTNINTKEDLESMMYELV